METRGRKRRASQSDLDVAVTAVLAGASYRSAEALTGVPQSTVHDYVLRWGFVRRRVPQGGPKRVLDGVEVSTFRTDLGDDRGAMPRERKRYLAPSPSPVRGSGPSVPATLRRAGLFRPMIPRPAQVLLGFDGRVPSGAIMWTFDELLESKVVLIAVRADLA